MASDKPKPLCVHQRLAKSDGPATDATESQGPCEVCKAESRKALIYRLKLIAGLLMPFALQALDVTMWVLCPISIRDIMWLFAALSSTDTLKV